MHKIQHLLQKLLYIGVFTAVSLCISWHFESLRYTEGGQITICEAICKRVQSYQATSDHHLQLCQNFRLSDTT